MENRFAERIRWLMEREKLTQNALAARLGVTKGLISHWLRGRSEPKLSTLQLFLREFPWMSPRWLLSGEGTPFEGAKPAELPYSLSDPPPSDPQPAELPLGDEAPPSDEASEKPPHPSSPGKTPTDRPEAAPSSAPPSPTGWEPLVGKPVRSLILLYEDGTFEVYRPRRSPPQEA